MSISDLLAARPDSIPEEVWLELPIVYTAPNNEIEFISDNLDDIIVKEISYPEEDGSIENVLVIIIHSEDEINLREEDTNPNEYPNHTKLIALDAKEEENNN
jgi:hypothetical protein